MSQYKVIYFDARGVAEPIRQLLVLGNQQFEDVRIPIGGLTPEKKQELGLEWGQLPVLEVDGVKKAQTFAICRQLARKFKLAGIDEDEEMRCDEIVEAFRDFHAKAQPLFPLLMSGETAKFEESKKIFAEVDAPLHMARFNKILETNESTWLVGENLTWADIVVVHGITNFESGLGLNLTKDFPEIQNLIEALQSHPKIRAWIHRRPQTKF